MDKKSLGVLLGLSLVGTAMAIVASLVLYVKAPVDLHYDSGSCQECLAIGGSYSYEATDYSRVKDALVIANSLLALDIVLALAIRLKKHRPGF